MLFVCSECQKLATKSWTYKAREQTMPIGKPRVVSAPKKIRIEKLSPELELTKDYGQRTRQAREKLGLTHEDLGRRISEKVSVLQKIETGKMIPDYELARKLEHALRIKLLLPSSAPSIDKRVLAQASFELTLGDVATIKKRKNRAGVQK